MKLDATWKHVTTDPALPVEHGTMLMVRCGAGYVMKTGQDKAKCLYKEVVPAGSIPLCEALGMFTYPS